MLINFYKISRVSANFILKNINSVFFNSLQNKEMRYLIKYFTIIWERGSEQAWERERERVVKMPDKKLSVTINIEYN